MAYKRTRDLLDQVRDFHRGLGAFYAKKADIAQSERARLLLDYMGRHEAELQKALAKYEAQAADKILDTWFKFTPDIAKCKCFDGIELTPDMTIDDIIHASIWFDDCLVEFYKGMAEGSHSPDVRELFCKLMKMERREELNTIRSALETEQS